MMRIVSIVHSEEWDAIVQSFVNYDVYYLSGYVKAFQIHGDGIPLLFYYESKALKGINVVFKRDISTFHLFESRIAKETYYDCITPYGYGGWLFEGNLTEVGIAISEYEEICASENIVSEFVRFHPLLGNAEAINDHIQVAKLGKTISMDLESETRIWENLSSKNRNVIRKAQRNNVIIKHSNDSSLIDCFIDIYNATMERDDADAYYYFNRDFYSSISFDLKDHFEIFYALFDEKIISISIVLKGKDFIHYHLSGSLHEYRHLAPSNLLLYEVACWGSKLGYKEFHLGGGLGSNGGSLFKFKQAFNRNEDNQFAIGKMIFDQSKYDFLVALRDDTEQPVDKESAFFPLYRS